MKFKQCILLGAILALVSLPVKGQFTLTTNAGNALTITGYTGSGGNVNIPSTINGLPVSGIGDFSFQSVASLTGIVIPDSVTNVGYNAFAYCSGQTSVRLGNGVVRIQVNAFYGNTSLTNVTIGSSITTLDNGAFQQCPNLSAIYFSGNAPLSVENNIFSGDPVTVYRNQSATGWTSILATRPVVIWNGTPSIAVPPLSQSVIIGDTAILTVMATGTQPLSYQWRLYGTNLPGATNSLLTITNSRASDAGFYSVMVSNLELSVISTNAVLQVLPLGAPSIQVNGILAVGTMSAVTNAQVIISGGFPGGYTFFTLDGSEPSIASLLYNGPINLTNSATVQAMSLSSDFTQTAVAPAILVQVVPIYNLQTSRAGNGLLSVDPSSGPYLSNSVVTLTATPASNWLFDHWSGDASGSQNPLNLTMNGHRSVQAVFVPIPFYSLDISAVGNGTVILDPPAGPYLSNSVVTLAANGSTAWPFDHWTGDASGGQNPLKLVMNGPRSVQAVFVQNFPITVGSPGGGNVTVNGQVIAPGAFYRTGEVVLLAANANSGWSFLGWQGDGSGTNNPLSVTVHGTNNIQAIFGTVLTTSPVGSGSIIPSQLNPIPFGTTITVSAVPGPGKYFVAWSGAVTGTNSPALTTITNSNPGVSALFSTLPQGNYSLGVSVVGNGSVSISPQQNYYTAGASVTLQAAPVPQLTSFYGWTHDASGTNNPIIIVMDGNKSVQANFGSLPIVNVSPLSQTVIVGGSVVLNANAAGLPPLSYQWQTSQGVISGATNASYSILNAQANNSGPYSVIISNPFGSVTSAVAIITVAFPPSIISGPVSQTIPAGAGLTLMVSAEGTAPLAYLWRNSGGPIAGQTNSILVLDPAQTNHTEQYSVIISSAYGAVTSQVASVLVYMPVAFLSQPANLIVPSQASAAFSGTAVGFPSPISYQWTHNGTNLAGATSDNFHINHVRTSDLGYYQLWASNGYSVTNSDVAILNMSPTITSPFAGATTLWGRNASLSVGAIGSGELSFQWYKDGLAIEGATNSTVTFSSVQFTDGGLYSVVVSSQFGTVTNAAAQVIVNPAGIALGFSPTLSITGVVGYSYAVQRSDNLNDTNAWVTVATLILTQPVHLWVDTNIDVFTALGNKYFYRVFPGQ